MLLHAFYVVFSVRSRAVFMYRLCCTLCMLHVFLSIYALARVIATTLSCTSYGDRETQEDHRSTVREQLLRHVTLTIWRRIIPRETAPRALTTRACRTGRRNTRNLPARRVISPPHLPALANLLLAKTLPKPTKTQRLIAESSSSLPSIRRSEWNGAFQSSPGSKY